MSTFGGLVTEIPGISLDRFDEENLSSSAYFLSHMHSDHTRGLNNSFFRRLKEKNYNLYCTRLTKLFIVEKYNLMEELSSFIKELTPLSPMIVGYTYRNSYESIMVNCIPAGHCPGSVMFIFQSHDSLILCTGDFRICPSDLSKIKPLNVYGDGKIVPCKFDKIYLDTTFLNPDYLEFPTRCQSFMEIYLITNDWISHSSKNIVSLECPALYGSEYLFMELMEALGKPVHVKHQVYQDFSRISELSRSITNDPHCTPIHACANKSNSRNILPCRHDVDDSNILTVVLSAMRWKHRNLCDKISEWDERRKNRVYVCCSMHPSYNELKAFVNYFQPTAIHPCVDPPVDCKVSAADMLNKLRQKDCDIRIAQSIDFDVKSLMGSECRRQKIRSKYISDDSSDSL